MPFLAIVLHVEDFRMLEASGIVEPAAHCGGGGQGVPW